MPQTEDQSPATKAEVAKNDGSGGAIVFDNHGNMVVNNRKYRRNFKQLWRAVQERRRTIHFYTKRTRRMLSKATTRKQHKTARQNHKTGRLYNGR